MHPRIGVDIGGTFTDGVLFDDATGEVHIEKVLTTPADLSDAFISTVDAFRDRYGIPTASLDEVMHASTIATNAIIEHKGARAGLLVTAGFRDVLEIGRQVRHELYNVFTTKPPPLVPRKYVLEARERIDYRGRVVRELCREDVIKAAELFRDHELESIAICFLHSYRRADHEQEAAEIIQKIHPGATLSVSSLIAPEIKEYWRASTTCVNAYVGPVVQTYLDRAVRRLEERGFTGQMGIMHSGGGIEGLASVKSRPFQLLESGPAAGVAAAQHFAKLAGYRDGLSFDMGGTTAKAGLIYNGITRVLPEFEVAGNGHSGASVVKASGYPVLGEVVDLVEVGAGGGSIAWMDDGGHLRVGPRGAGANPGPACYDLGGVNPTITDANLVLGRLDAHHFLGGTMTLSRAAAENSIRQCCAVPLGVSVEEAAYGIIEIADSTMIAALRLVSVERGYDPREFCLIAFGGAGPVHAASLASKLEIPTVLVLPNPGVASAWGLLLSDVKHDVRMTVLLTLDAASMSDVAAGYESLYARLEERLAKEETAQERFRFQEYLEARYVGQSSRLRIGRPIMEDPVDASEWFVAEFHKEHEREFGYCVRGEPISIVTLGVTAIGARKSLTPRLANKSKGVPSPKNYRDVSFSEAGRFVPTPVYDRGSLTVGYQIAGPAIVEEFDSTTVVTPGFTAEAMETGVLKLESVSDVETEMAKGA